MRETVKIQGFEGIDRALGRMTKNTRAEVLERVVTESADGMLVDYTYGAPSFLRRFVAVRTADKAPGRAQVNVGTKHPLAHIFEFGTRLRRTKSRGSRGRIEKIGFARRAFDSNVSQWFIRTGELLWREVKRGSR